MSVSHWWLSVLLTDSDFEKIKPDFEKAENEEQVSKEATDAVQYWKENPKHFEAPLIYELSRTGNIPPINDFLSFFMLTSFEDFGEKILTEDEQYGIKINEETIPRFISISRDTPISILWHAMGYEKAIQLPGKKGNLLVHSSATHKVLSEIKQVFKNLDEHKMVKRALAFSYGNCNEKNIMEIITMMTYSLEKAIKQQKGILFLSRVQLS